MFLVTCSVQTLSSIKNIICIFIISYTVRKAYCYSFIINGVDIASNIAVWAQQLTLTYLTDLHHYKLNIH